jgi:hypothetical protein
MRYNNLSKNIPHGDVMANPKPSNTTRLYCQNTNGFQLVDPTGGTFNTANLHLQSMQVDIAGFVEANVDTT